MTFKVSKVQGQPQFDSLPVAKITLYPTEERDYKPYAQCVLCVGPTYLALRMWAFEVSPPETSLLRAVFYLFQNKDKALYVDLPSTGEVHIGVMENAAPEPPVTAPDSVMYKPFGGEDLQGVYWGGTLYIPFTLLESLGGETIIGESDRFWGNFYKLCSQEPFVHQGSAFPADFSDNPYTIDNMGSFLVVGY